MSSQVQNKRALTISAFYCLFPYFTMWLPWGQEVKVSQLCPTCCNPMDYTVQEILQARILEWIPFPFYKGSSQHRDQPQVSCIAGRFFTNWAMRKGKLGGFCSLLNLQSPGQKVEYSRCSINICWMDQAHREKGGTTISLNPCNKRRVQPRESKSIAQHCPTKKKGCFLPWCVIPV